MRYIVKKTLETIVKSKNDYIVQVKGNQKNLFNQIKKNIALGKYLMDTYQEQSSERGRDELRITKVYKNIEGISPEWSGIKRVIETTRYVKKKGEESTEIAYHISSIAKNKAKFFANHIRSHWGIENRLHWVKDTLMIEDKSKTKSGNAPENLSIMRNISINLFRLNGKDSIKLAMEWGISNFKELMYLIYYKSDYNMII